MRERRRTGQVDAKRTSPGEVARDAGMHQLLALQRSAGNAAVVDLLQRMTKERDVSVEEKKEEKKDVEFDLLAVKERWRTWLNDLQDQKKDFGKLEVLHDSVEIELLLAKWDVFRMDEQEYQDAKTLAGVLKDSTDKEDKKLYEGVTNAVEQQDRQFIISEQLSTLGNRQVLAVLGNGRLEALCFWKVISGTKAADPDVDANWWVTGWETCFYIEELSAAPWNVGWPSEQPPVKGAGSTLIDEAIKQARVQGCDGIGLFALRTNVGFYVKVGFAPKKGNALSMTKDLTKKEPEEKEETKKSKESKESKDRCSVM